MERQEEIIVEFLFLIFLLCIPLGVVGGLAGIWIDPSLGDKIVNSSLVIGVPSLLMALWFYSAFEESEQEDEESDGGENQQ